MGAQPQISLVGDDLEVPCVDGVERRYLSFDAAASTNALPAVAERVGDLLPWYSSVHRGAGYKSQLATAAYEDARAAILRFARRCPDTDVAIICRNTTEAINHLAYRLDLQREDVVVTTVVEHHANLLPWTRAARCRLVGCDPDGTFAADAVRAALDAEPSPRLLAITGASNVTGWMPPLEAIIAIAHERGVPVAVDAAQLAPHRPLPAADFLAFSGHKMYAPFGAGALIGPRAAFEHGAPFLVGGGAVDLVEEGHTFWAPPPEREEAGSPNVLGAAAFAVAAAELGDRVGWDRIRAHDRALARRLRDGLAAVPGVRVLGPGLDADVLPIATFVMTGVPHALVAARLSAEFAIGVRHGCFCAHPYLMRLLGVGEEEMERLRAHARRHDHQAFPGAVRASAGISTSMDDVERLLEAVEEIATSEPPVDYGTDPVSGDFWPVGMQRPVMPPRRLTPQP